MTSDFSETVSSVGPAGGVADTPLMKQYWELKTQAGDALLLFRMGDFYELFGADAVEAARILEITLTSRDKNKPNPVPMCGVPHHSIQAYIQRLLKAGKKVAIGEQMEDPATAKNKLVRRAIVRMFTPGVQFDAEGAEANYLAALVAADSENWVLACLDVSTGEVLVGDSMNLESLESELLGLPVRHVLLPGGREAFQNILAQRPELLAETLPQNYLSLDQAREALARSYGIQNSAAFANTDFQLKALGTVVVYTLRTQQQDSLPHLRFPVPLRKPKTMVLGPRAAQHLDLVPAADGTPSMYALINRTSSALGARQLKRWLLSPLKDCTEIGRRQSAVRELSGLGETQLRSATRILSEVYDLERILGRVTTRLANPRDTLALGRSLASLPSLAHLLANTTAEALVEVRSRLSKLQDNLGPLAQRIMTQQKDEAPLIARDGGIFNTGVHPELDRLLSLSENGQAWLLQLEAREREQTGISSLKVRYNRVFGYYIEVTQAHLKSVPAHYQRKQTTVGAERFFTEELKKFEDEIVNASTRQKALEQELFSELIEAIRVQTADIMDAALVISELDSLLSLARLAQEPGWCFPQIDDSLELQIQAGRHPLVDQAMRGGFVPNDVQLSPDSRLTLVITGPNMGGKSTVMRQTALIVILGQIGGPVPAANARWGALSSLYTRIGAHDAIARGQSTFMVEMSELAHILHYADERSLIVLDEIGRGTSTYDGISVAWAALEWICSKIRCRTLFATHYHELTRVTAALPHASNAHMAVEGTRNLQGGTLRFLYKLKDGPANESFGIHVAQIAGLPRPVIQRAWNVLEDLERHSPHAESDASEQLSLFGGFGEQAESPSTAAAPPVIEPHPVILELEGANLNEMTPLQALNLLAKLREMSLESSAGSAGGPTPPGRQS